MHAISISDSLYASAQRAAAAIGLSVEAYVQEALQVHLGEEAPVKLTTEQVAVIEEAEADIDAGKFFTSGQMREYFAQKKTEWTPSRTA